jgi:hypothetical protein
MQVLFSLPSDILLLYLVEILSLTSLVLNLAQLPELEYLELFQLMLQAALVLGIGDFDLLLDLVNLVFSVEYVGSDGNSFCQCAPSSSRYYH